jgi:alpha-mannosidase
MEPGSKTLWGLLCIIGLAWAGGCSREAALPQDSPEDLLKDSGWLQGYHATQSGGTITYQSPHPDVTSALLVRSLDERDFISWETEPLPEDFQQEFATFVWIFGMDVDNAPHSYDLYVNGRSWFQFSNPLDNSQREWQIQGNKGSRLHFRATKIDQHGDVFGYAAMRFPVSALEKGKPALLKVVGESAASRVWYMTFQSGIQEEAVVVPQPALIRQREQTLQPVFVYLVHMGDPQAVVINAPGTEAQEVQLSFGFNRVILYLPPALKNQREILTIQRGNQEVVAINFDREPVRPWYVYLVHHTHTDIGYTRPQTEILPEHLRFIDYALDYCDKTDDYPDDARFRWTCEAAWAVDEYLKVRPPQQIQRLQKRIKQGRIEVTALPFNLSEIADENILARSLNPLLRFKDHGIHVTTAMQNDVNGIAWCLADYFPGAGVRYLNMGQHGHRARIPFDKPTAFWWESPSGRRVLAFRADHYNTGNFWGIHTGQFESTEEALLQYLGSLQERAYPFNRVAVQYAGYFTDNSPPATVGCDFIRDWNKKYAQPRLRSATAQEFFTYLEQNHGSGLPVHRAAWPDWWSDGFGSSARETAAARIAQAELIANQGILAMARLAGISLPADVFRRLDKIVSALLFWDEHTMGAAESISDPHSQNSELQWAEKSAYVWEALKENRLLREAALGLVQESLPRLKYPSIVVFNTLGRPRSGLVEVYIDHEILPPGKDFSILDETNTLFSVQKSHSRADGTYWIIQAQDIPAFGYRILGILPRDTNLPGLRETRIKENVMENQFYRLELDGTYGSIRSWVDKESGTEFVDPESFWQLGQFIHERISNRGQLERFRLMGQERDSLTDVRLEKGVEGAIWNNLYWSGTTGAATEGTRLRCELRLFNQEKRLELHYTLFKRDTTSPEAIYVAFPFKIEGGELFYEVQGGSLKPGEGQLEGTSADWHALQNFCVIQGSAGQIVLCSPEIPLVHFGGLNLGKFPYIAQIDNSHVYSWVMNNYWVTNFRASQQGEFRWSYALTSSGQGKLSDAAAFGWNTRVPMLARVFPSARNFQDQAKRLSFLKIDVPNVLLISALPTSMGSGIVLHVRETQGISCEFTVVSPLRGNRKYKLQESNVLGEPLAQPLIRFTLKPFETKFFRLIGLD